MTVLRSLIGQIALAIVAALSAGLVITNLGNVTWEPKEIVIFALSTALVVIMTVTYRALATLKKLGVVRLHERVDATIQRGLDEAETDYRWLGTSAHFVVCSGSRRADFFPNRPKVNFEFVTLDADHSPCIREQAEWENERAEDLRSRIEETRTVIEDLAERGVRIRHRHYGGPAVLRIVLVDQRRVYVSTYEQGKMGPYCQQLELRSDSILGAWMKNFYERTCSEPER